MEERENTVRLTQAVIRNLKNTAYGRLELTTGAPRCGRLGSILGIYGPNGSGKTVAVDAMALLKCLLTGAVIPHAFGQYIRRGTERAELSYGFAVRAGEEKCYAQYQAGIERKGERDFVLCYEKLRAKPLAGPGKSRFCTLAEYVRQDACPVRPRAFFRSLGRENETQVALGTAGRLTEYFDREEGRYKIRSFLFSQAAGEAFSQAKGEAVHTVRLINSLKEFGTSGLTVVENARYGLLTASPDALPVNMKLPEEMRAPGLMIKLGELNLVPREVFPFLEKTIRQINLLLASLIPGIRLEICNVSCRLTPQGGEGAQFELATLRDGERIPLMYESAGIKKIISICSNLVECYNREGSCLVVDELDSGIYEYLLGEYLEAVQERARGQLIFTSHNLRPLEVLDRKYLAFTTANPENRYVKASCMRDGENTRLSYLRALRLGGLRESLYDKTNQYAIELALKKAGRVEADGK